ncbi:MAG: hypothetical protein ABW214_03305 [Terrimicrobiaceae bacterium]
MEKALNPYVLELLDSYGRVGGLNNQDAHNTPSKRAVGQVCEDLLDKTAKNKTVALEWSI